MVSHSRRRPGQPECRPHCDPAVPRNFEILRPTLRKHFAFVLPSCYENSVLSMQLMYFTAPWVSLLFLSNDGSRGNIGSDDLLSWFGLGNLQLWSGRWRSKIL